MPVSAWTAANTMLAAAEERGLALDPLKLQKLLYLTNGYYLAMSGERWISDSFEAWKYGPVIPGLYKFFKGFGSGAIKKGTRIPSLFPAQNVRDSEKLQRALDFVLNRYGARTGIYLSELTHKVDSPWWKTRRDGGWNAPIPENEIKNYFSRLVAAPENA